MLQNTTQTYMMIALSMQVMWELAISQGTLWKNIAFCIFYLVLRNFRHRA